MKLARTVLAMLALGMIFTAGLAQANARLVSVTPVSGGCVAGPSGPSVQFWEVEPGKTYDVTITGVTECGNGGTAPTIGVRLNNTGAGNTDLVATLVSPGTYVFRVTIPAGFSCTGPLFYCTTPGAANSGIPVLRNDGAPFQAHLRAATFGPGCTNATPIGGPGCTTVGANARTWGQVKAIYR